MKVCTLCGFLCSCVLLSLEVAGWFFDHDHRDAFHPRPLGYEEAIQQITDLRGQTKSEEAFLSEAVRIYHQASAYAWPTQLTRISATDNWLLASMSILDLPLMYFGFSQRKLFGEFESYTYTRAFRRGFGICSQNSLGFADLLFRRFGIKIKMLGLGGHVVTMAEISPKQSMILDPSLGISLPFSLAYAETHPEEVADIYGQSPFPALAHYFNPEGNILSQEYGASAYSPTPWKQNLMKNIETFADGVVFLFPALASLFFARRWRNSH